MPKAVRDDMTLDEALDLFDYWRDEPPVQWMVQAYLGIKPKTSPEAPVTYANIPPMPNIPFKP